MDSMETGGQREHPSTSKDGNGAKTLMMFVGNSGTTVGKSVPTHRIEKICQRRRRDCSPLKRQP